MRERERGREARIDASYDRRSFFIRNGIAIAFYFAITNELRNERQGVAELLYSSDVLITPAGILFYQAGITYEIFFTRGTHVN